MARFELVPLEELQPPGRPRVDVLANLSGSLPCPADKTFLPLREADEKSKWSVGSVTQKYFWVSVVMCVRIVCVF